MSGSESVREFRPEEYRGYLRMLAQTKNIRIAAGKLDASDLVQECLLKAHAHQDQFAGSLEVEYRAWLRSILANVALEAARRYNTQARTISLEKSIHETIDESGQRLDELLVGHAESPTKRVIRQEMVEAALAALDHLPANQREAIRLHHLEQMPIDDVATAMNRTAASVSGLVRRGLRQLRAALRGDDKAL